MVEIIVGIISSALYLIGGIFFLIKLKTSNYLFIKCMISYNIFSFLWLFLRMLSIWLYNFPLQYLSLYALYGVFLSAAFFNEVITSERISLKIVVMIILVYSIILFSMESGAFGYHTYADGSRIIEWEGNLAIIGQITVLYALLLVFIPFLRIHHYASNNLKKYSRFFIIAFLLGIFLGITQNLLPAVIPIFTAIIMCCVLFGLFIKPQLGFVLPFKVIRLTVLNTKSGIPLFDFVWNKESEFIDESLYAGMFQGITLIMKESIGKGNIQKIQLENSLLLLDSYDEYELTFILMTNTITRTLKQALAQFADQFIHSFNQTTFNEPDISKFASAKQIVEECFVFIPD